MRFDYPRQAFERVQQVSEINDRLYQLLVSPWVRPAVNPWTAEVLKWLHPMRMSRYLFSESFNPWMRAIELLAKVVEQNRVALPQEHSLLKLEREGIEHTSQVIEEATNSRDAMEEQAFSLVYGNC